MSTGSTGGRHNGVLTEAGVAPASERAPAALERLQTLEDLDIENEHWLAAFEGDDDDDALLVISQSQSPTDYVWGMSCNIKVLGRECPGMRKRSSAGSKCSAC